MRQLRILQMRVMGLDVSATATGIAVLACADGKVEKLHEEEVCSKKKGLARAMEIADRVNEQIETWKPDEIAVEGYSFGSKFTLVILVEVGTVVRMVLHMHGRRWLDVPPTSLKKFVTGSGKGEKDKIMLELYKRWGLDPASNNTGDAMGAAVTLLGMQGKIPVTKVQQEAIKKLVFCN